MPTPRVIAITGLSGSGKSLIAAHLLRIFQRRGLNVITRSFAAPLKIFLHKLGITRGHPKFRDAAQFLSGLRGVVSEDVYARPLADFIGIMDADLMIVDDMRFPNELCALWHPETMVSFRLVRNGAGLSEEQGDHESEQYIPDLRVDYEIHNNGTPEDTARELWYLARKELWQQEPIRAYIAGPLSGRDFHCNVERARILGENLRQLGFWIFVPHTQAPLAAKDLQPGDADYEQGLGESMSVLQHWAECVVVPDYTEETLTHGVQKELEFARNNDIPVFSVGEIP